jgi:hypothetical protein
MDEFIQVLVSVGTVSIIMWLGGLVFNRKKEETEEEQSNNEGINIDKNQETEIASEVEVKNNEEVM